MFNFILQKPIKYKYAIIKTPLEILRTLNILMLPILLDYKFLIFQKTF